MTQTNLVFSCTGHLPDLPGQPGQLGQANMWCCDQDAQTFGDMTSLLGVPGGSPVAELLAYWLVLELAIVNFEVVRPCRLEQ